MLMTTILAGYYLYIHRFSKIWIVAVLVVYILIEGAFLAANMLKFTHGGWVSVLIASVIAMVMIIWYRSNIIKNRLTEFVKLEKLFG